MVLLGRLASARSCRTWAHCADCLRAWACRVEGLAELVGVGPDAAENLGQTVPPAGVEQYDETVTAERVVAVADLYYLYQNERIGVLRVVLELQELFRASTLRLSTGHGLYSLGRFDRRQVLRHTRCDRLVAYRRVPGHGTDRCRSARV